jgi:uncharacterized SAM-binding protein YcdF (DUF218 family)
MTADTVSAPHRHRKKLFRIGAGVFLGAALLAVSVGWLARGQILQGVARAWVVSDPITQADAIAVLGGGLETRPFAAADLYKKGIAKRILLADVRLSPTENLKIIPSHVELNRAVLLKLDVPPEAIAKFGTNVSNTFEEAHALGEWAKANGIRSIIVPTEIFSSRRVRWILDKQVGSTGVRVQVQALSPPEYDIDDWWRHGEGVIAFQNEVIKYLYYRIKY